MPVFRLSRQCFSREVTREPVLFTKLQKLQPPPYRQRLSCTGGLCPGLPLLRLVGIPQQNPEAGHARKHFVVARVTINGLNEIFYRACNVPGKKIGYSPTVPAHGALGRNFLDTPAGGQRSLNPLQERVGLTLIKQDKYCIRLDFKGRID